MKKLMTFLIVMICLQTMAQKPIVLKPASMNREQILQISPQQIQKQIKYMEIIKKDFQKKTALLNATVTQINLSIISPDHSCRDHRTGINDIFEEKKFVMYAGGKGIIVEANTFELYKADSDVAIYVFSPLKTISYKELIDQNISFNMDLIKSRRCGDFGMGYSNLYFNFKFSDGTIIWGSPPGSNFFEPDNSGPLKGEVHVSRYLQPNIFPDLDK